MKSLQPTTSLEGPAWCIGIALILIALLMIIVPATITPMAEQINNIINPLSNKIMTSCLRPPATLKQIRERRITDNVFFHKSYTKMLQTVADTLRVRRRHEHEQINKIIPGNSPNPNKLTILPVINGCLVKHHARSDQPVFIMSGPLLRNHPLCIYIYMCNCA